MGQLCTPKGTPQNPRRRSLPLFFFVLRQQHDNLSTSRGETSDARSFTPLVRRQLRCLWTPQRELEAHAGTGHRDATAVRSTPREGTARDGRATGEAVRYLDLSLRADSPPRSLAAPRLKT